MRKSVLFLVIPTILGSSLSPARVAPSDPPGPGPSVNVELARVNESSAIFRSTAAEDLGITLRSGALFAHFRVPPGESELPLVWLANGDWSSASFTGAIPVRKRLAAGVFGFGGSDPVIPALFDALSRLSGIAPLRLEALWGKVGTGKAFRGAAERLAAGDRTLIFASIADPASPFRTRDGELPVSTFDVLSNRASWILWGEGARKALEALEARGQTGAVLSLAKAGDLDRSLAEFYERRVGFVRDRSCFQTVGDLCRHLDVPPPPGQAPVALRAWIYEGGRTVTNVRRVRTMRLVTNQIRSFRLVRNFVSYLAEEAGEVREIPGDETMVVETSNVPGRFSIPPFQDEP